MLYGKGYKLMRTLKEIDMFGNLISKIGLGLTATVIGAEIGVPLMNIGGYISLGAKGMTIVVNLFQKKYSQFVIETAKLGVELGVGKLTKGLIEPIGKGMNQEIGAEINSQFTSEVVIPMVEQQTKTVN